MFVNYYEVLGVSQDATDDEIRSAYRKKSKDTHPDVNQSPSAEADMTNVNAAYERLRDPDSRVTYDRQLEAEMKAAEERRLRNSPEVYIEYIHDELRQRLDNMFGYVVRQRIRFDTYRAEIRTNFHSSDGQPINVIVNLDTENQGMVLSELETIPKVLGPNAGRTPLRQVELGYRQVLKDAERIYGVKVIGKSLQLTCDSWEKVPERLFDMVQAVQYISAKADLAGREARYLEESLRKVMPERLGALFRFRLDEDGHLEVTTAAKIPNGQMIRFWWVPATEENSLPKLTDWGETFRIVAEHNGENISVKERLVWGEANEIYGTGTENLNDKEETLISVKEVPDGNIADSALSMIQTITYIAGRTLKTRDPQYYMDRGVSKRLVLDMDEAISDFTTAIALDPQNATAYCHRARAYLREKQFGEAIEDLDTAIRIDDRCAWAYHIRASVNEQLGNEDKAIDDWSRAIQLSPGNADYYYRRGLMYFNSHRLEEASKDLDASISLNGEEYYGFQLRAMIKELQGNYGEAIDDLSAVIRLAPTHLSYAKRGSLYSVMEQYEQAIADY